MPVRFYATDLAYHTVEATDQLPVDEEGDVTFKWDWQFVDHEFIDILLGVSLGATQGRPENVQASMVGAFRLPTETPEVSLEVFAKVNGPTMLMPYLRQAISSLTSHGYFGAFLMPPINIHRLIAGMENDATGVRQIEEDSAIAALTARLTLPSPTPAKKLLRGKTAKKR